jgi:glutamine---fructose-6-phosphate transaminase (isomerizing)
VTITFAEGVAAQPANLRVAARALRESLPEIDLGPLRSGTLVFSGIGASWYALTPAVRTLQAAGRRAFAVPPQDLAAGMADAYVVVSQSGRSAETLAAVERVAGAPVVAVSASGQSQVARAASAWLPLGDVPDTPLSTLGYTATLQALGMLCEAILGGRPGEQWDEVPDLTAGVLEARAGEAAILGDLLAAARTLDAIGGGAHRGSAGAAALLAREGLRLAASGEETRQYLHGPLEAVGEGVGCLVFGGGRERELAEAMASYGAAVAIVGAGARRVAATVTAIEVPAASGLAAPILDILPVQLAVTSAAAAKGLGLAGLARPQGDTKLAA